MFLFRFINFIIKNSQQEAQSCEQNSYKRRVIVSQAQTKRNTAQERPQRVRNVKRRLHKRRRHHFRIFGCTKHQNIKRRTCRHRQRPTDESQYQRCYLVFRKHKHQKQRYHHHKKQQCCRFHRDDFIREFPAEIVPYHHSSARQNHHVRNIFCWKTRYFRKQRSNITKPREKPSETNRCNPYDMPRLGCFEEF